MCAINSVSSVVLFAIVVVGICDGNVGARYPNYINQPPFGGQHAVAGQQGPHNVAGRQPGAFGQYPNYGGYVYGYGLYPGMTYGNARYLHRQTPPPPPGPLRPSPPPPPPPPSDPNRGSGGPVGEQEVDVLYHRLERVLAQIKDYSKQLTAQTARLSAQSQALDHFKQLTLVTLNSTDDRQTMAINSLNDHMSTLMLRMTDELSPSMDQLQYLNDQNARDQLAMDTQMAAERLSDASQFRDIERLAMAVDEFKDRALQVKENAFRSVETAIESDSAQLTSMMTREMQRKCETGQVTLRASDASGEHQYDTTFHDVPQVIVGLCGFTFSLDSQHEDPASNSGYHTNNYHYSHRHHPYHHHYHHPQTELVALGGLVRAQTSRTRMVLHMDDLSFMDDSVSNSVDVCFQACSIGPGQEIVTS